MKITELEKRLYRHADTVKNNMTAPFGAEIRGLIEAAPYYEERTSTVMRSKRIVSVIPLITDTLRRFGIPAKAEPAMPFSLLDLA